VGTAVILRPAEHLRGAALDEQAQAVPALERAKLRAAREGGEPEAREDPRHWVGDHQEDVPTMVAPKASGALARADPAATAATRPATAGASRSGAIASARRGSDWRWHGRSTDPSVDLATTVGSTAALYATGPGSRLAPNGDRMLTGTGERSGKRM